jgi:hypothetical protein
MPAPLPVLEIFSCDDVLKQIIKTKNSYSVSKKLQIVFLVRQNDPLHQPKRLMAQSIRAWGFSVVAKRKIAR